LPPLIWKFLHELRVRNGICATLYFRSCSNQIEGDTEKFIGKLHAQHEPHEMKVEEETFHCRFPLILRPLEKKGMAMASDSILSGGGRAK